MLTEAAICPAVIGFDVGKFSHWACCVTGQGEVLASPPVVNAEFGLDALFAQARNIGRSRYRGRGSPACRSPACPASPPRRRRHSQDGPRHPRLAPARAQARREAGGREVDGVPEEPHGRLLHPRQEQAPERTAGELPGVRSADRPDGPPLAEDDGIAGRAMGHRRRGEGGRRRRDPRREQGAHRRRAGGGIVVDATVGMPGHGGEPAGEDARQAHQGVGGGDRQARCGDNGASRRRRHVRMPADRSASRPQDRIRAGCKHRHRRLPRPRPPRIALRRGPRNRRSGTSISSVSASRQGNKRLKNLLIFSCNSLSRSKGRFGDYYRRCRKRGMCHGEALKAVARKRMGAIYAIMRDRVPYSA